MTYRRGARQGTASVARDASEPRGDAPPRWPPSRVGAPVAADEPDAPGGAADHARAVGTRARPVAPVAPPHPTWPPGADGGPEPPPVSCAAPVTIASRCSCPRSPRRARRRSSRARCRRRAGSCSSSSRRSRAAASSTACASVSTARARRPTTPSSRWSASSTSSLTSPACNVPVAAHAPSASARQRGRASATSRRHGRQLHARDAADAAVPRRQGAHPDVLVLFRVGDFYEMFFEDAVTVLAPRSHAHDAATRARRTRCRCAACPYHAARHYLGIASENGHLAPPKIFGGAK